MKLFEVIYDICYPDDFSSTYRALIIAIDKSQCKRIITQTNDIITSIVSIKEIKLDENSGVISNSHISSEF